MSVAQKGITIANELLDKINGLNLSGGSYHDISSLEIRRLIKSAEKLKGVGAVTESLFVLGAIHQLCGNIDEMHNYFKRARETNDTPYASLQYVTALISLGFISEAQKYFVYGGKPEHGQLSKAINLGIEALAIDTISSYVARAVEMNIYLPNTLGFETAARVNSIFKKAGVSDELAASILDEAGAVLRSNRLLRAFVDTGHFHIFESPRFEPCVMITWYVPVSPEKASFMMVELSDRLVERFDDIPQCLSIGFQSSLQ